VEKEGKGAELASLDAQFFLFIRDFSNKKKTPRMWMSI